MEYHTPEQVVIIHTGGYYSSFLTLFLFNHMALHVLFSCYMYNVRLIKDLKIVLDI